jgi:transcriptional regulator with XRE-family HTH domain
MPSRSRVSDVGQRLAAARRRRGLSQGTVCRLAGMPISYLSRIETGKVQPTFRTVLRVAAALKAAPEELLGRARAAGREGACPVSTSGRCMLDLIRAEAEVARVASGEVYTTREVRLLQRLAAWMRAASPDRLRALEVILDDLLRAAGGEPPRGRGRQESRSGRGGAA